MRKGKVLFLCTGNSARSQMAEAFLRKLSGGSYEVFSAGIEPKGINPLTVQVMQEKGISLDDHWSKSVQEYLGREHFGHIITVCAHADQNCPAVFLTMGERLHWNFDDPAAFQGSEEEKLQKFREIRDQIETKIVSWLKEKETTA